MNTSPVASRARRIVAPLAAALAAAALASCSTPATPATVTVTDTTTVTTAPPAPTDTATTPPAPPAKVYTFGDEWTLAPATEAQGSGCAPGVGPLPDGVWFGFVHSWTTSSIDFDLACWWSGATAESKAAADGLEAYDFYITNDNKTLRAEPVAADAVARKAAADDGVFTLAQVIADPGGSLPTNKPYPAWLYISGGEVTAVAVQYTP